MADLLRIFMTIAENDITVGRCYVTELNQVRRVIEISGGKVTYEEHTPTSTSGVSLGRSTIGIEHVARQVAREVPCEGAKKGSSAGWT